MNKNICSFLAIFVVGCARAQNPASTLPQWRVTLHALDEAGRPVAAAEAKVWYYVPAPEGQSVAMTNKAGLTDQNGVFVASERSNSVDVDCEARKQGYYTSGLGHEFQRFKEGDQAKWSPTINLLLKTIGKPIPMFVKRVRSQPPVAAKPVGYDLELGDWVAPHGKGSKADILFATYFDKRSDNDWDYKLIVSFPNPGDGIQPFTISEIEKTSALRSPHQAPENGYEPKWVKAQAQRPGERSAYGIDKNLNFFFRVRTVLDEKGNVRSANYGKIYGDFMDFEYFLNPQPNSRDIEFDPGKNLMKQLGPDEHVNVP